ncbi:MAG: aldo/keto reductase [Planctomycetota bacterium]|nr:aldo/keto reductase [Planctomycetota bacterium]
MRTKLEQRQLGRTGVTVTRLGAGGHFTNGPLAHEDIPRRVRELNHLLDLGVSYFDVQWDPEELATAEVMATRASEFTVAWPLHGMNQKNPREVRQYVLDYAKDHRTRYGIRRVDILLWVGLELTGTEASERVKHAREAFEALEEEGFCDHFAFSCHHSPQTALRAITEFDAFDALMVPYSPLHPAAGRELLPEARRRGVGTVAMKPFGGGGGFLNMVWAGQVQHPAVKDLRDSAEPYAASLRWVLNDPNVDCTVPGAHSVQQIDELHQAVMSEASDADGELLAWPPTPPRGTESAPPQRSSREPKRSIDPRGEGLYCARYDRG